MTVEGTNIMRRLRTVLTAAGAALALVGCAATHVGEDWQCPLAQGSQCTSVAAADPAVKDEADRGRMERPARAIPAHGATDRRGASGPEIADRDNAGRRDCGVRCNPFAWLARVFGDGDDGEARGRDDSGEREAAVSGMTEGSASDNSEPTTADGASSAATASTLTDDVTPATDLRAPETLARVWIAPFVDAEGVYREASWVRIVIAPAEWKRP